MGQRIREFDWSSTSLGPVHSWPQNLRTCVRIMLTSRQPIWIGWGRDLIKLYNDPYKTIVGGKHPWALGMPASTVWKDIWRDIEPMLKTVMEQDEGTYVESQLLIMERNGYPEETYYTFSYTPIPGDDGTTAGMICANTDDTDRIISERQLKTITELGKSLTDAKTSREVISRAMHTLGENPHDFPFASFYSVSGSHARLHKDILHNPMPDDVDLNEANKFSSLFSKAISGRKIEVYDDLKELVNNTPKGAWEIEPDKAIILPVAQAGSREPYGVLVIGCNPYRLLDEKYSSFFSLVADQIATSFASVNALEEERKRAEAFAEIDRAKTIFFSNISHEFRTPLTLLMGPVEDTLNDPESSGDTKERMHVAYRNVLRMQKLVNTLLEFSRIEAGRIEGRYRKVDIVAITEDLTSTFRSAVEKAGMELRFIANEIDGEIYVDIDMWERIILNLLSNAFKYSKNGVITVDVRNAGKQLVVAISDTGSGIPEDQLDKIFNRFHRVENSEGRSQEGTGIGLALVKELVKLHGGVISVSSKLGEGSTFTVSIPTGKEHLNSDKVSMEIAGQYDNRNSATYLHEALKWIDEETPVSNEELLANLRNAESSGKKHTIVFADDNADMRDYVEKLLRNDYMIIKAVNGEDAFEKIMQFNPDLVLSDVMMPKLDGFGLLDRIRNHPAVKSTPVILLSAKAGEEAKVEGLTSGADDYMVKPFSAKELVARVDANIKIAQTRLASERNLRNTIMQSPVAMSIMKGDDLKIELVNEKALVLWGKKREEVYNIPVFEAFPELIEQGFDKILSDVYTSGKAFIADEMPVGMVRNGEYQTLFVNFIYEPLFNAQHVVEGIIGVGIDVTEQVRTRQEIEQAEERAVLAIESADLGTYTIDLETNEMITSKRFKEIWGIKASVSRPEYAARIHPDDLEIRTKAHQESIKTGKLIYEARIVWEDKSEHWVRVKGKVLYDQQGKAKTLLGVIQDISEQKLFADELSKQVMERTLELQRSNEDLQQFAHVASHDLKEPVRKIKVFSSRLVDEYGPSIPDKGMEFIGKIQHATDRMISMIEGVLTYSGLNATEQAIEVINLNEIIDSITADLEVIIEKKGAVIRMESLPLIEGAEVLIYQLFYNLINNSLKFSKPAESPVITIQSSLYTDNDIAMVEISVSDNGIGFQNEHSEKIFNTFARLNSKDKYEGTGLGLALCRKIVERHNGYISAHSEKGSGATFIVQLPIKQTSKSI